MAVRKITMNDEVPDDDLPTANVSAAGDEVPENDLLHVAAKQWNSRVVDIPDNMRVEAGGTVIELIPCPAKEGYVDCVHHDIVKFVLTRPTECGRVCV